MQRQVWQPELVIFVGLQASGKSTFYQQRCFAEHVRLNLDMLKTRHRERTLLHACIAMQQHCVVDNTDVLRAERAVYISAVPGARFRVIGYMFEPDVRGSREQRPAYRRGERPDRRDLPHGQAPGAAAVE